MSNVYSPTQLEFLRRYAAVPCSSERRYTQSDVRTLANVLLKDAGWNPVGSGGWLWNSDRGGGGYVGQGGALWDTNQGAAGNLSGWGGLMGSLGGGVAGATAGGTAGSIVPGAGTAAGVVGGGVAGSVAGGAAGRGLGYGLGSAIDTGINWFSGKNRVPSPSLVEGVKTTLNPWSMGGDALGGAIIGVGKPVAQGGKYLLRGMGWNGAAGAAKANVGKSSWQIAAQLAKRDAAKASTQAANLGLTQYTAKPGQTALAQIPGRVKNFGENLWRSSLGSQAGRRAMLSEMKGYAPFALLGKPTAEVAGTGLGAGGRVTMPVHFANTKGYTNVVGNANRGLSGVTPIV